MAPGYDVINLGGGRNPISMMTVIGFIEKSLNRLRAPGSTLPATKAKISGQPSSPADMAATWADIAKAKRLLGWSPQITPEEGFKRTVQWHIDNQRWLSDIRV
ncbi:hypothetical protein [Opitutus sp. GAS368]|uniref:hypothetical protein n=1 Tax=Opitutus sp. GAS368 TaxID=1882749 RepID=UPI000B812D46|nr:hypothetical protein [Opitutus sp. GAS368]